MPMPMKTHLTLNIITHIFMLTGGTAFLLFLKDALHISLGRLDKALGVAAIACLVSLVQYVFWRWIPAACPKCGGHAFPRPSSFGRNVCRDCGVESSISMSAEAG